MKDNGGEKKTNVPIRVFHNTNSNTDDPNQLQKKKKINRNEYLPSRLY